MDTLRAVIRRALATNGGDPKDARAAVWIRIREDATFLGDVVLPALGCSQNAFPLQWQLAVDFIREGFLDAATREADQRELIDPRENPSSAEAAWGEAWRGINRGLWVVIDDVQRSG